MIIWCFFNSTVDGTPRDFLWRDKLILRIMNIRIWWSYNNILLFGIFELFGTWRSDDNHGDQIDEHQLQINFAGACVADCPCYIFCICMLTNKYQKYKPVELEDQLLWSWQYHDNYNGQVSRCQLKIVLTQAGPKWSCNDHSDEDVIALMGNAHPQLREHHLSEIFSAGFVGWCWCNNNHNDPKVVWCQFKILSARVSAASLSDNAASVRSTLPDCQCVLNESS